MPDTIEVTFSKREFAALAGLLDAAVRASGLRAVVDVASIIEAMSRAEAIAEEKARRLTPDA